MLTCSNCGASVREGARFCTTCGTRLNDPVSPDATDVWATPEASEPAASSAEPAAAESISTSAWSSGTADQGEGSPGADPNADAAEAPVTAEEPDMNTDSDTSSAAPPATTEESFTWSWGTSSNGQDGEDRQATGQVDEESSVVLEEAGSEASEAEGDELVDATEIDILEVDTSEPDPVMEAGPNPETSDSMLVVEEREDDEEGESETLAAWAEQWESPEPDGDSEANDELPEQEPEDPTALDQAADTAVAAGSMDHSADDEEDTVARAERLIGELRSIIPSLVRPMASAPVVDSNSAAIADELEGAAQPGQFDDVRETLQAARANPRDVDTMLSLSGKIDRLLELLDDRDNLARMAGSAATRLRPADDATEV
ncbi:MAG: zinc-ribbon domain-containing protein [Chloroflexota bacterium]|nr:zinc-ribbon domain-containing protein [Chloroflexota bacterium]